MLSANLPAKSSPVDAEQVHFAIAYDLLLDPALDACHLALQVIDRVDLFLPVVHDVQQCDAARRSFCHFLGLHDYPLFQW